MERVGLGQRAASLLRTISTLVARRGLSASLFRLAHILQQEGATGLRTRFQFIKRLSRISASQARKSQSENPLAVVPVYPDSFPAIAVSPDEFADLKVAVHLCLQRAEKLEVFWRRLHLLPVAFDLFVAVPAGTDIEAISEELRRRVRRATNVVVEKLPDRGGDIASLIVQFGSRLVDYDIVGHFHVASAPDGECSASWRRETLELLIGSDERDQHVAHIFRLLRSEAKFVYAEGRTCGIGTIGDKSGWPRDFASARSLLETRTSLRISDLPEIEFPEDGMFWARAGAIKEFLLLPLNYDDFPQEPIAAEGALFQALQRLPLVFAASYPGKSLRLQKRDSIRDYRHYEEQEDFTTRLAYDDVRVLSYYLPQFHAIEENDRWHGAGFTEWTKVRAANPLFQGHYQQHIPHADIGYYLLDDPDVLRKQADMMHKAGISGQVFYHYWFSGKLILERPARLLLENPEIDMPFCFCWANENWTRKWDGNEDDVLLRQSYSADDARAFIEYLIPFFRDRRYIRIDDRPTIFVYRPSAIPNASEYMRIWAETCEADGLRRPYVIAVLTRGASNPRDYDMDAGVERSLHDWTSGNVGDIAATLVQYQPRLGASVLPYADVAKFYRAQNPEQKFTYFRSLVPNWDNSARYGPAGYLLHGSTPELFQQWMEGAIGYARRTLPADRRLVLINAWNEWAEGAHLEPDNRYGYAYLNAVGRALSDIPYSKTLNLSGAVLDSERIPVRLTASLIAELQSNRDLLDAFRKCVAASTIRDRLYAYDESAVLLRLPEYRAETPSGFTLEFRAAVLFGRDALEKMIELGLAAKSSVIVGNAYGRSHDLIQITANGSTHFCEVSAAPVVFFPSEAGPEGYRNFRVRTDAHFFADGRVAGSNLPDVTTIVRFHRDGDLRVLQHALFCLAGMVGCRVTPLIAAQDLSPEQIAALERMVRDIPWVTGVEPTIRHYTSGKVGDLRSVMMNKSLQQVATRYAAFLDFDDRLMPHAYEWLLTRLRATGKAVAIGRVYASLYDPETQMLTDRARIFQYGYSYDDFFVANIAPLHSFMLDLSKLEIRNLKFFDDQKYLEDYFLLLQLVRRGNTDWAGLSANVYIGDYLRFRDGKNTLAIVDSKRGDAVRDSAEFISCEKRIRDLRASLSR